MKYHDLDVTKNKPARRSGRGIAAGRGKTAGRGTKGQAARTGHSQKPGFEGGQTPLMQRIPKLPGFKSHRVSAETVTLDQIASLKEKNIDAKLLANKDLITSPYVNVKLLNGSIKDALNVKLPFASASAVSAIEEAGGSFTKTPRLARPASKDKLSRKAKKTAQKTH